MICYNVKNLVIRGEWLGTILIPFCKLFGVRTFFDFHGFVHVERRRAGFPRHSILLRYLEMFSLKNANFIICQNEYNLSVASKYNSNLILLENGVDLSLFENTPGTPSRTFYDKAFDLPKDKRLIGFVAGHFGDWVDLKCMLDATAFFEEDIHLVVIGNHSNVQIKDLEAYSKVTFTGGLDVNELAQFLSKIEICVYSINPRYINPFPMSPRKILDWIAMRIPMVITDFNPKPKHLVSNVNVLFSKPGSPSDLASKTNNLMKDKTLRESMKAYNTDIRKSLSWEARIKDSNFLEKMRL